ncbi:monooxygenase (plasmid) [Pseudonocardia sp. EC080610-09]|uniref:LLM class flavin-dependent oxidoreductase n=1 Tax=unclassified Pseudonocardia TaxID=2619320 RepID=UPI000706B148|nr:MULTISPECIES: LLM class flavin-dependent oxidoreductase [unclassified Pseudonocardia]ALL79436.1 monooxygenase [Pseudonocardia sp. EC080610-09]ALL85611.1 monooxygenase [Pseudonocardia sp. EC080619-01]
MAPELHLNAFIHPAGHHEAAWRHPATTPDRVLDADYYHAIARTAEDAAFDAIFFADIPAVTPNVAHNTVGGLDPITLLASIAAATSRIGLIATASTTYYDPYNLARLFASVDHLSKGRAGWNIVTTALDAAAANYGLDAHPDPAERYARATEFLEVVTKLWDGWEDGAVLLDRAGGRYADLDRIHPADHVGPRFRVRGPLTVPRSPQGHPVLVQAGSSNDGRAFAARHAEAIFTAHQRLVDGQAFYRDVKDRAAGYGRVPSDVAVLPGISPFIGDTEEAARALEREFDELTVPEYGLRQLEGLTGVRLTEAALDRPVPDELFTGAGDVTDNARSRLQVIAGIVERERPTVRGLLHRLAGARGHRVVTGTAEQVADTIEEWFTHGAADGFNVMPPFYPGGLELFTSRVVPLLRERGLFRTGYTGTTLREHLGLRRPPGRYAAAEQDGAVGA